MATVPGTPTVDESPGRSSSKEPSMASFRKLPSGKWQATVRLPDGRRLTRAHALKGTVKVWAEEEERRLRQGDWVDPRNAQLRPPTLNEWLDRWLAARVIQPDTAKGDVASIERIRTTFGARPLGSITRLEVQAWVKRMHEDGVGAHAVRRAYSRFATAHTAAVVEGLITETPCRKISLPTTWAKQPDWFTEDEVDRLVLELPEPHATMTLVMCWLGLRWGECAGLRVQDVDWLRRRVRVVGALSQTGQWQPFPKSTKSRRDLPAPPWLIERMAQHVQDDRSLLFVTATNARPHSGSNWRKVWREAVARAGVRNFSPHACRHTCASWLVQGGATLYDVQVFLGHEDPHTTTRYAHLAPDAYVRIEAVWREKSHQRRTDDSAGL